PWGGVGRAHLHHRRRAVQAKRCRDRDTLDRRAAQRRRPAAGWHPARPRDLPHQRMADYTLPGPVGLRRACRRDALHPHPTTDDGETVIFYLLSSILDLRFSAPRARHRVPISLPPPAAVPLPAALAAPGD